MSSSDYTVQTLELKLKVSEFGQYKIQQQIKSNVEETQIEGIFVKMEEKVSEIPPEKIDTIVSTKDEKKVNDKNEEGLSQIEKLVVRED